MSYLVIVLCLEIILFSVPDDNYPKCKCAPDGEDSMLGIEVAKQVHKFFSSITFVEKIPHATSKSHYSEVRGVGKF